MDSVGESFGGKGDMEIGAKERTEASDHDPPGLKTTKQLVACQPRKGGDGDRGGGAEPERRKNPTENGAEARTRRKLGFFLYMHPA